MELEPETGGVGLKCCCTVEHLNDHGQVLRKQVCKASVLDLGRNEVEDVVLRLSHSNGVLGPLTIREHAIHRRFLKEGKATIVLKPQKMQLLISNCPPYHLGGFLQSMTVKVAARGKVQGSHRRMLGDISTKFHEISPLNAKDIEKATAAAAGEGSKGAKVTPSGRGAKSRMTLTGKENQATTPHRRRNGQGMPRKRKLSEMSRSPTKSSSSSTSVSTTSKLHPPSKKPPMALLPVASSSASQPPPLSAEQARVLQLVKSGESVFFTGSAGTGKSYLLRRIIKSLPPDTTFPTASTGSAACLIGGTTLHSFAGVGTGAGTLERCVAMASREPHLSSWRRCRCLVIDEVSMVDAELFEKLEGVARAVRRSGLPFGGIQLVVCGDFLQLPPVSKESDKKQFCFQVSALGT